MATAKQEAQKVLDALPDGATIEDTQYRLYVLQKIEGGLQDVEAGRVVSQENVEQRMSTRPQNASK